MNKKASKFLHVSYLVVLSILVLLWVTMIVMTVIGQFFAPTAEVIEDYFGLIGDKTLLSESSKYLIYSSFVLVVVLLYRDLKSKYLSK